MILLAFLEAAKVRKLAEERGKDERWKD